MFNTRINSFLLVVAMLISGCSDGLVPCKQGPFKNKDELTALLKSLNGKPQDEVIKTLGRPDIANGDSWQYSKAPGADYCSEPDTITQKPGRLGFGFTISDGKADSLNPTVIFLSDEVLKGTN